MTNFDEYFEKMGVKPDKDVIAILEACERGCYCDKMFQNKICGKCELALENKNV